MGNLFRVELLLLMLVAFEVFEKRLASPPPSPPRFLSNLGALITSFPTFNFLFFERPFSPARPLH